MSLSGLPHPFTDRISAFATEFEVEYTVLGAVDDQMYDVETIRDWVFSTVQALSDDQEGMVNAAIDRLIQSG